MRAIVFKFLALVVLSGTGNAAAYRMLDGSDIKDIAKFKKDRAVSATKSAGNPVNQSRWTLGDEIISLGDLGIPGVNTAPNYVSEQQSLARIIEFEMVQCMIERGYDFDPSAVSAPE